MHINGNKIALFFPIILLFPACSFVKGSVLPYTEYRPQLDTPCAEERAAAIDKLRNEDPEEYMRQYYSQHGVFGLADFDGSKNTMLVRDDAAWLELPIDSCLRHTGVDWKTTYLVFFRYGTTGISFSLRTISFDQEHDTLYIYVDTINECYGTPPPQRFNQSFLDVPAHTLAKATAQTKVKFVSNHTERDCGMVP